ncbi:MAG: bifunctional enoyl-CoA hydratase/phosphate acetyltransferase [Anaerovoracaceae bacterium]
MAIKNFEELKKMASSAEKRTVAVACAHDAHTLEAVLKAHEEGLLDYILIGKEDEIVEKSKLHGTSVSRENIVNCESDELCAAEAVKLVNEGKANFIQKGLMQTATLLKAVVNKETGLNQGRSISHVALIDIPKYHKIMGVTDGGMIMYPNLEQKKDIVLNAIEMFHGLGYEEPKIAALCAVETVNPKMPETLDAQALKEMAASGEIAGCCIEGPISMDLAVSREAAAVKKYDSPVAGDADILLVPSIYTGNIMVKALIEFAGTLMAGCVIGAKCPIALNSRSASFEEKYYSLLACSMMVEKK